MCERTENKVTTSPVPDFSGWDAKGKWTNFAEANYAINPG